MTVLENVLTGAHVKGKQNVFSSMLRIGLTKEEQELQERAYTILNNLELIQFADQPCEGLPFGTMKRIELARALINEPKLLLLDEPATGLNHSEVNELSHLIKTIRDEYELTILLVEEIAHSSLLQTGCELTSPFFINFLFLFRISSSSE